MARSSPTPGASARNRARPVVEPLEDRIALNAGDLDPTFGIGGQVLTNMTWYGRLNALAALPDGRVLAGGSSFTGAPGSALTMARYLSDGTLDPTFGLEGRVRDDHLETGATIRALGLQSNGAIVVTGHAWMNGNDLILARYDASGTLDSTFGDDGIVTASLGQDGVTLFDLAIMPDDRIVVAGGLVVDRGATHHLFVARFLPDGSPDPTFGDDGIVTTDPDVPGAYATTVKLYDDGRIIVGGPASYNNEFYDVVLARYLVDGTPDPDFGEGGLVRTQLGNNLTADIRDLAVLPGGAIVAVGGVYGQANYTDISMFRYLSDGQLDSDFGTDGLRRIDFGHTTEAAETIVDLGDGKYILAGHYSANDPGQFFVGRLTADMEPDPLFGSNGWVFTDFSPYDDDGSNAFIATPDGRLIAGGNSNNDFLLAAYQNFPEASLPPLEETFARGAGAPSNEGTKVKLLVELSRPTIRQAKVGYTVIGGTAKRDRDYVLDEGKVKFEPGQTQQFIKLKILDDQRVEPDETIILKLKNPRFATLASDSILTYTIVDDDSTARSAIGTQPNESSGEALLLSPETKGKVVPIPAADGSDPHRLDGRPTWRSVSTFLPVQELPVLVEERPVVRRRVAEKTVEGLLTEFQ